MQSTKAKPLTNLPRPAARYRKGKAPLNAPAPSDSDSDADDDAVAEDGAKIESDRDEDEDEEKPQVMGGASRGKVGQGGKMAVALREVAVDAKGMVTVGGRGEVGRTEKELESEAEEEESEEEAKPKPVYKPKMPGAESDEEGSSEYETDSEDEPAPIYKPVFVSKRNRDTIAEREKELDPDVLEARRQAELEHRKKQSHDLVAESILRELAEKEVVEVFPDVDDADGLDPQAEFEGWKLRELMRIKSDKEAQYAREKEREEVEARRALPEGLRMKEDMVRANKSRQEKQKGQQVFLQKYHHKGAFYTGDLEVLKKHDYTAPTTSTNRNVEDLPAVMQVRNFGKAHQTKYTHLAKEDTTNASGPSGWGAGKIAFGMKGDAAGGGCFTCGGPHLKRDCPQANAAGPSGSNGNDMGGPTAGATRDGGWGAHAAAPPSASSSAGPLLAADRFAPSLSSRFPRERDDDDGERQSAAGWEKGGERQRERYEAATGGRDWKDEDRGRDQARGGRYDERNRDVEGNRRDSRRDEGRRGDRLDERRKSGRSRSRSRSRSPPARNTRDGRERERPTGQPERDDKRRRVD